MPVANVKNEIFLRGPKSTLWLETFFQCPPRSDGRRLRNGDKNTVRVVSRPLTIDLMPYADSDIIHVNGLGTSIIILNSYKVATDLLDKRSSTYSSR